MIKPLTPTPGHTARTEPNIALLYEMDCIMAEEHDRMRKEMGEEAYIKMMDEIHDYYEQDNQDA